MKDNALYLEVDEDITSAIDKLRKVAATSVQIVVPKRSTLLQSVINQKLLKKAAETAGKTLVLVTNDRVATDLAARVGLAVAPALGAEAILAPIILAAPVLADDVIDESDPEPVAAKSSKMDSVASKGSKHQSAPTVATHELSDDEPMDDTAAAAAGSEADVHGSGPSVPNFSKLMRRSLWLGLFLVVVAGYFVAMYYLTKGTVTLHVNGVRSDISEPFSVDTSLTQSDQAHTVLAGVSLTASHNLSTTFVPTGKKDVGTKASGTVAISNNDTSPHSLVAGTRFTAPDGNVFFLNTDTTVAAATPAICGANFCKTPTTVNAGVTASKNGDNYNEAGGQAYSIPGLSAADQALVSAKGNQMSGGTSKSVNVVLQADVDKARDAAAAADLAAGRKELDGKVPSGDQGLATSLVGTPTAVASNPAVDGQGDQATLTLTINYTMTAVKTADYTTLMHSIEQKQLGASNQIYDDGFKAAVVTAGAVTAARQDYTFATTASGGPKFDLAKIASDLRGKKYSEAADYASAQPGVAKADVTLWPAWATKMPHVVKHITVAITVNKN